MLIGQPRLQETSFRDSDCVSDKVLGNQRMMMMMLVMMVRIDGEDV